MHIRSRVVATALAAATALALAAPAPAVPTRRLPDLIAPRLDRALGIAARARVRAEHVRAALRTPGWSDDLAVALSGGASPIAPAAVTPAPDALRAVRSLPSTMRRPVAGLLSAVRRAIGTLGRLPRPQVDRALRASTASVSRWMAHRDAGPRWSRGPRARPPVLIPPAQRPATVHPGADVAAAIERSPIAALQIASALDRYVPALRAAAAPSTGTTVDGCDVLDRTPVLCIGGSNDNVYTTDAALLIDEGGNDTYRNSAGAAPFLPDGAPAYIPVSVIVDETGDDTYAPTNTRTYRLGSGSYTLSIGDGAGVAGGVGIVVDEAGSDVHRAVAAEPATRQTALGVLQGASMGGVGAILDGGGADTYTATAPNGHQNGITLVAQGASLMTYAASPQTAPAASGTDVVPAGVIADRGATDDSRTLDAGVDSSDTAKTQGFRGALAQGYALVGSGLVADDGGTDSFAVRLGAARTDATAYPGPEGNWAAPQATVNAQGFGLGPVFGNTTAPKGYGLLVEGPGTTSYRIDVDGAGLVQNQVWGQGWAGGDGFGMVDDRGGNDTYSITSALHFSKDFAVDDSCGCESAAASFDAYRALVANWVSGQGASGFTSEAVLHDEAGDDTYTTVASADLDVSLHDDLTAATQRGTLTVTGYGPMALQTQGYGGGGEGVLLDDAGTDAYTARSVTDTRAVSDATTGTPPGVTAFASGKSDAKAQGASAWLLGQTQMGALVDRAGTGDRFDATSMNSVSTPGDPDGALQAGYAWPQGFQGNGFGGLLVAQGQTPHIRSVPAQGVCPQSPSVRGFGTWTYCGMQGTDPDHQVFDGIPAFLAPLANVWAAGYAPNATGAAPTLRFSADTPAAATAESPIDVQATLLAADGTPIAGVPIHFDVQADYGSLVPDARFDTFIDYWEATGVTDANGVAHARVPLAFEQLNTDPSNLSMRLMATFDGADGLYPAHVVKPITVQRRA